MRRLCGGDEQEGSRGDFGPVAGFERGRGNERAARGGRNGAALRKSLRVSGVTPPVGMSSICGKGPLWT